MPQEDNNKQSVLSEGETIQTPLIDVRDKTNRFDDLSKINVLGYGVGHFVNDLTAACWFNYAFYFLRKVVKTDAATSALLSGQIADGIATMFIGYASDKVNTKYGQRIPWYFVGLILVIVGYLPTFHYFKSDNVVHEYVYYIIFPVLFNLGWASLQISHMSLVPSLTCSRKRRDKLNNLRNTFTFISNFTVLGLGLIIFSTMDKPALEYEIISYIVIIMGVSASIFFLYQIRQVPLTKACRQKAQKLKEQLQQEKTLKLGNASSVQFSEDEQNSTGGEAKVSLSQRQRRLGKKQTIFDWFKMPKFYLFGICYMGVRLFTNMFGTFLPFFLTGVLKLGIGQNSQTQVPFQVALVPLIVYLSSSASSFGLNWFYQKFGRKIALSTGTVICVVTMGSMLLLTPSSGWVMYILAAFIGVSQTMVLSTGINFISDVVGAKAKTGAFVFGIYSLVDKFSSGLVIFFIGNSSAYTKDVEDLDASDVNFIKYTMVLIPALSSVLATLIVISYPIEEYSKKNKKNIDQKIRKSSIEDELVV